MQLFKAFLKAAFKHLPSVSIYFIIYAVISFVLAANFEGNMNASFQSKALNLCIIDGDRSEVSAALTSYLGSLHKLVELENDPEILQDHLYYRFVDSVLTIPEGFEEKLLAKDASGLISRVSIPGSAAGFFVDQQINQYLQTMQIYTAGGYSLNEAAASAEKLLSRTDSVEMLAFEENTVSNQAPVYHFYRFLPYILIALLFCGLSPIVIIFNKKELRERTLCSPLTPLKRNLQLSLGCTAYSIMIWIGIQFLGFAVYGGKFFKGNAMYAMLNSLVFLLVAIALTLFVSLFSLNTGTINMIANLFGLGMSFLCGLFVDQSLLSEGVLKIARFLPAYWYIRANNMLGGLSNETFDMKFYWTAIGIQLLFAAAIFAVTLASSAIRRPDRAVLHKAKAV